MLNIYQIFNLFILIISHNLVLYSDFYQTHFIVHRCMSPKQIRLSILYIIERLLDLHLTVYEEVMKIHEMFLLFYID